MQRRDLLVTLATLPLLPGLLAACAAPPPPRPELARIGFGHRGPLRFDLAEVVFRNEDRTRQEAPQVGHLFPDPPAEVAERWVAERLRAEGGSGRLEAILREASVTETALPRTTGLRGLVTRDQSERYDARLVLALRAYDGAGDLAGGVEARVEQSTTVAEDIGRGDRTAAWHRLTESLARRLDEEMERAIRGGDLGRLLR